MASDSPRPLRHVCLSHPTQWEVTFRSTDRCITLCLCGDLLCIPAPSCQSQAGFYTAATQTCCLVEAQAYLYANNSIINGRLELAQLFQVQQPQNTGSTIHLSVCRSTVCVSKQCTACQASCTGALALN